MALVPRTTEHSAGFASLAHSQVTNLPSSGTSVMCFQRSASRIALTKTSG
jgi:hypothetical protein